MRELLQKLPNKPQQLFLIDAAGALLSTFLLGVVLVQFESHFGMPREALYILAAVPCGFMVYDLLCYQQLKRNFSPFLKGISLLNVGYCGLSVSMLVQHAEQLTTLGWLYFVGEVLIVMVLAGIEWQFAKRLK